MKKYYTTYSRTEDMYQRASEYSREHPFPDCWGYGPIGDYCPKEKPRLSNIPKECKSCPLFSHEKFKKSKSGGSGGYGDT